MTAPALARRLGTADATLIGLGSMIGAGVFAAFTPAAQAAGSGLLIGLLVAAIVAVGNATSSAQLAAVYPASGGTYVYGRERLGPWWGFAAGWSFVIGKTASAAAMALVFAAYAAPVGWERVVALVAVLAITAVTVAGITRTALATRIIVSVVLVVLALVVAAGASTGWPAAAEPLELVSSGPYGILQSAGLLFFAFAGYARLATLGEEVREPARTIPRAIVAALAIVLIVYAAIALTLLGVLGAAGTAAEPAALQAVVIAAGWGWAEPVVRAGAAAASLGALLALMTGIGRTVLAMAREGDLPRWFAAIHPGRSVPQRAQLVLGAVVCAVIAIVDVRGAIGFSSFGVLLYYLVTNIAALTQPRQQRRFPRALAVIGAAGCVVLAVTLPWPSVLVGAAVLLIGILTRLLTGKATAPNS